MNEGGPPAHEGLAKSPLVASSDMGRSPWITFSVFTLAWAATWALPSLQRFRPPAFQVLARTLADPLTGRSQAPLWVRLEAPKPSVMVPSAGLPSHVQPTKEEAMASLAMAEVWGPEREALAPSFLEAGETLDTFREALARAKAGQDTVRICHFGDSPNTGDLITGEARARLQEAYGDGGHGWILVGRPWEWYGHLGLDLEGKGWRAFGTGLNPRSDHAYGLAGQAFGSSGKAETRLKPWKGRTYPHVELHYLPLERGGHVQVFQGTDLVGEVDTKGSGGPALKTLSLPEGSGGLRLQAKGDGEVLLFGAVLERGLPGVVLDSLGANGGAIQHLAAIPAEHWKQALTLRRPDLVILAYGTNEAGYVNLPNVGYRQHYREVVRRIREALPQASILMMGPMDRGERTGPGQIGTLPNLLRIIDAQRSVARELGIAYFDTQAAMGGEGAAGRWYRTSPRLMTGDFTHPTRTGADRVAALLVSALLGPGKP